MWKFLRATWIIYYLSPSIYNTMVNSNFSLQAVVSNTCGSTQQSIVTSTLMNSTSYALIPVRFAHFNRITIKGNKCVRIISSSWLLLEDEIKTSRKLGDSNVLQYFAMFLVSCEKVSGFTLELSLHFILHLIFGSNFLSIYWKLNCFHVVMLAYSLKGYLILSFQDTFYWNSIRYVNRFFFFGHKIQGTKP